MLSYDTAHHHLLSFFQAFYETKQNYNISSYFEENKDLGKRVKFFLTRLLFIVRYHTVKHRLYCQLVTSCCCYSTSLTIKNEPLFPLKQTKFEVEVCRNSWHLPSCRLLPATSHQPPPLSNFENTIKSINTVSSTFWTSADRFLLKPSHKTPQLTF